MNPIALIALASLNAAAWAPAPADEADPPELEKMKALVRGHVEDLEAAAAGTSQDGLKVTAYFIPDALAYRTGKEYLKRRADGTTHEEAVRQLSLLFPSWKRREGMAAVRLKLENVDFRPETGKAGPPPRRVFTLQKDLLQALALMGPEGKRLTTKLAEAVRNLRSAQLRKKKFWTTANGSARAGAYDPDDLASIGRKPLLSKPFPALVLEEKPAEAELIFKFKAKEQAMPRLCVSDFWRYEGPFRDDQLDLNGGRRWDPIQAATVELRAPPGGLETPRALEDLVAEVRKAASGSPRNPKTD